MCGRYTVRGILPVAELFGVALPPEFQSRYNVAPSQDVPVIRAAESTGRRADLMRWGLIPSWTKGKPKLQPINAKSETAATSAMFRQAMERRRCLVPADGFYEWKGAKPPKQPHLIRMKGNRPFGFAGLWERWRPDETSEPVETFTILTTTPNELVAQIHNRMPVIVGPADFDRWLDPKASAADVAGLLKSYPAGEMEAFPVSTRVNSPKNDDAACIEPSA